MHIINIYPNPHILQEFINFSKSISGDHRESFQTFLIFVIGCSFISVKLFVWRPNHFNVGIIISQTNLINYSRSSQFGCYQPKLISSIIFMEIIFIFIFIFLFSYSQAIFLRQYFFCPQAIFLRQYFSCSQAIFSRNYFPACRQCSRNNNILLLISNTHTIIFPARW